MKRIFQFLLCAALVGAFCGGCDDEGPSVNPALLHGTWRQTARDFDYNGKIIHEDVSPTDYDCYYYTFNADGTGSVRTGRNGSSESFTYRLGSNLAIDYGDGDTDAYRVERATGTELALSKSGRDEDGAWYERHTFERLN